MFNVIVSYITLCVTYIKQSWDKQSNGYSTYKPVKAYIIFTLHFTLSTHTQV